MIPKIEYRRRYSARRCDQYEEKYKLKLPGSYCAFLTDVGVGVPCPKWFHISDQFYSRITRGLGSDCYVELERLVPPKKPLRLRGEAVDTAASLPAKAVAAKKPLRVCTRNQFFPKLLV